VSYVFAFLCGLAAAALHMQLLRWSLQRALAEGSGGATRVLWLAPLRLLATSSLIAAPTLWCGGAGALLALVGFTLLSQALRWRALRAPGSEAAGA
jgi:hypothetical protein